MKKTISLFLAVLMLMSTMAIGVSAAITQTFTDGGGTYSGVVDNHKNGTATLTSYDCSYNSDNKVFIPSKVYYKGQSYYVEGINRNAFKNASEVTSLTVPSTVTSLYPNFSNFDSLVSLTFNDALTDLDSIYGCPDLKYINITENTYVKKPHYTVYSNVLFEKEGKTLVRFAPAINIQRYYIPEEVTKLCDYAFAETSVLKELVMYPGLSLDYYTFCNSSIEKVYFWGTQEEWDTFESKIHCNHGGKCGSNGAR